MGTKLILLIGVISMFLAAQLIFSQEKQGPPAPPPARMIPGITADDRYPRACVDCHLNYTEMKLDTRFKTLMDQWSVKVEPGLLTLAKASAPEGMTLKGKHPKTEFALADIPGKCMTCHAKASKMAPPFASLIHNIHLTRGDQNHFLSVFQGECTHCHKLNKSTGSWKIPSAPEG